MKLHVKLENTHTQSHTQNTKLPSVVLACNVQEEVSGMQAAQCSPRDRNVAVNL